MFSYCFVASGSKGNASLFYDGKTLIQIDMGITKKALQQGLDFYQKQASDIAACFVTHEHSDHIAGIPLFHGKVPIYASFGTLDAEKTANLHILPLLEGVEIGDFTVMAFPVSHDAAAPVNYLILHDGIKFAYVTDTGYLPDEAMALLHNCDYYLFESNHDVTMLRESSRPAWLKRRIHGTYGHLSNVDSAKYICALLGEKTKAIYLAHLSEECNDPEKALASYRRIFKRNKISFPMEKVFLTKQWEMVTGEAK